MRRAAPIRQQDGQQPNAGLGLPLAKLLTERHGGRFLLESRVGAGTTATVILPAERMIARMRTLDAAGAAE
jgi:signal transduction histidine kinase